MIKLLILSLLSFCWYSTIAQDLKILSKSDKSLPKVKESTEFVLIDPSIDTARLTFVATIETAYNDRSAGIEPLFIAIRKRAKKSGANCFMPKFFSRNDSLHTIDLVLNTYFATDSILAINQSKKPTNSLFLFAGEKGESDPMQAFKFNDSTFALAEGTFFEYTIKENEAITVCKPGFESMKKKIAWNPGSLSTYLMLRGGYAISNFKPSDVDNLAKLGGYIADLDKNFGELLIFLFNEVRFH